MSRPFDDDFRRLVLPALKAQARVWAKAVADGIMSHSEALDWLCWVAVHRGATYREDDPEIYDLEAELETLLADLTDAELNKRGET